MHETKEKLPASILRKLTGWRGDVAAFVLGALTVPGFAPFHLFILPIFTVACLFLLWHQQQADSAWRVFLRGWLFGAGLFFTGVSWVYVSLHEFGNMNVPLAVLAVIIFVAILSTYTGLVGLAYQRLFNKTREWWRYAVVLPVLWVLFEWTRGWFLTGFPWLALGYSQVGMPLSGLASWLGVYGVSLMVSLSAGLVAVIALYPAKKKLAAMSLLAIWLLAGLAGLISWAEPTGEKLAVATVQANVPITMKWQRGADERILDRYLQLSRSVGQANLMVWPEAAIPRYLHHIETTQLPRILDQLGSTVLVTGVIERETKDRVRTYYNSALSLSQNHRQVYRKRHLVPFGEFLPLKPLLGWLLDYLHIPMSNFSEAPDNAPVLRVNGITAGLSICYEDAFGEEVIDALPQAALLINISEDAWFGDSLAAHQRMQMARMRAIETARPMIRAANTGPSALIDHSGRILATTPQFQQTVLKGEIQPMQGLTPYARWGNWPVVLLSITILAGFLVWSRTRS